MEYWKQIEGYPHLLISSKGRIWTLTYNRELKPYLTNRGYMNIGLNRDKVIKTTSVHRLVAQAFIPNPNNLPAVDHIDGNKLNNNVENLQWISNSDNCRKAVSSRGGRIIPIVCVETGKVYRSIKAAATELKMSDAVISAIIKGEFPSYHGLSFVRYTGKEGNAPHGYLTTGEYARKHNVSASAVKQRVFHGNIPYIKFTEGNVTLNLIKEDEPWVILKPGRKAKQ